MNTFKVNPKSWHYHFAVDYAKVYHHDLEQGTVDFCQYSRQVLLRLLLLLLGAFFATVFSIPVTMLLVWVVACITSASILPIMSAVEYFGMFEIACALFTLFMYKTQDARAERKKMRAYKSVKEPGFISQAYHSFKDKYCFQCELVSNNDASIQDTKWPRQ